ncbi:hypothetical protein DFS33DRAFT_158641 [Desarmillaria ectypa]|nr:hypothetical protein DFS33DRAFT_158641 [Desarmillaria ectypa]
MDGYRHEVELYNPYDPQPEAGPSMTEYKNEARTGLLIQSPEQRPERSWLQHGLCFTLHGLLVCVHFLILLIWITRAEHHATVPIGRRSSIISTAIVQVSQIIGTLYLAGLIFVSQQLGARRNARTRQTLTATSDNMAAWSGLGAALASLWRQKALVASLVPSLLVVGYFVCIAVLNITTPAIFSLQPFNQTRSTIVATTLGKPNISVNSLTASNPTSFWLDSTPVVPYLARSDRASKIGLENGTLYDVILNNGGKGTVSLNATTFNISCGYVDGASVTDNGNLGNWSISTPYQGTANSIPVLAPDAFKWLPLYPYTLKDPWRHAVFYTSANITDSNGSNGVRISLNPPMQPSAYIDQSRMNVSNFSETAVYSMQIIGCTISLINQSAAIDAESHLLQHVLPSGMKNTSQWSAWQPDAVPAKATTVSASSQSTKIAGRAEETSTEQYDLSSPIADPVTMASAEWTDPTISEPNNPTTNPYPTPGSTTTEATPPSTEQYGTTSIDDSMMTQTTTVGSEWIDTATSDSSSLTTDPPVIPGTTSSKDLQTSSFSYSGASFAAPQNPNPTPADPMPAPAPQDSNPPPASGDDNGGVGGAAPQDPSPKPAPPNNGGGGDSGGGGGQPPNSNPGAPAPQDSNPNPAPPSDGGTSGGEDRPQFASPQDPNPNPAPPNNGGSSPQPQNSNSNPPPAPQNSNPNPAPSNNDGGTPPSNSNPGSNDSGGVGGAAPQDPNPKPASPNSGDSGGGGAPQNSKPNPAPDGGGRGGDRAPQFASPQDPNPNPPPPNNGGGSNSGNGDSGNGGGGGNSSQGTNTPGKGKGQSKPPTAQSDSSGQGQSNPGQGDGQQNSDFGAAGQPPSDNSNTSPQNPPVAQGQDTTGSQQNPPGTGNSSPAGNGDTPGQSDGGAADQGGSGQDGGSAGGTGDGTQGAGGTGGTSGQDSGGQSGMGDTGDTSGQGAESTGSDGSDSGAEGQGSVAGQPTSNGVEQPTVTSNPAAVAIVTLTTIKTTIDNVTMTATAARSSGTPATVSYYDSSDVFLGVWWELFNQAALSRFPSTDDCPGHPWQNPEACNPFTVIEQFVMEDLGFYPVLLDSPVRSGSKVTTLHDLENSLASATAASYWAGLSNPSLYCSA